MIMKRQKSNGGKTTWCALFMPPWVPLLAWISKEEKQISRLDAAKPSPGSLALQTAQIMISKISFEWKEKEPNHSFVTQVAGWLVLGWHSSGNNNNKGNNTTCGSWTPIAATIPSVLEHSCHHGRQLRASGKNPDFQTSDQLIHLISQGTHARTHPHTKERAREKKSLRLISVSDTRRWRQISFLSQPLEPPLTETHSLTHINR